MQIEQPEPGSAAAAEPARTPANLADLVGCQAARTPDAVAIVESGPVRRTLTWAELDRRVEAGAAVLNAAGLLAGQRLALLGANSAAFVVAYLAALRAGVVVVPVNPQSTPGEVAAILTDSRARVLLTDAPGLTPAGVRVLTLSETGLAELAAAGPVRVSSPRDAESLAVLLYPAGTSGRPEAAMLSHRALLAHVAHLERLGVLSASDTVLAVLPLCHVFGLTAVLGGWAGSGARLVVTDGYPEGGLALLVRTEQVTQLPLAPPTLQRLLAEEDLDLGPVTAVVCGAAPLPELAERFRARTGLPVQQGYGLTEAAPGVTATFGHPDTRTGEQVVAFVQGRDVTPGLVAEHCGRRLARFKRPAAVAVLEELRRGATGKVRKGRLREMLLLDHGAP